MSVSFLPIVEDSQHLFPSSPSSFDQPPSGDQTDNVDDDDDDVHETA